MFQINLKHNEAAFFIFGLEFVFNTQNMKIFEFRHHCLCRIIKTNSWLIFDNSRIPDFWKNLLFTLIDFIKSTIVGNNYWMIFVDSRSASIVGKILDFWWILAILAILEIPILLEISFVDLWQRFEKLENCWKNY